MLRNASVFAAALLVAGVASAQEPVVRVGTVDGGGKKTWVSSARELGGPVQVVVVDQAQNAPDRCEIVFNGTADTESYEPGGSVEIEFGYQGGSSATKVFTGEIVGLDAVYRDKTYAGALLGPPFRDGNELAGAGRRSVRRTGAARAARPEARVARLRAQLPTGHSASQLLQTMVRGTSRSSS